MVDYVSHEKYSRTDLWEKSHENMYVNIIMRFADLLRDKQQFYTIKIKTMTSFLYKYINDDIIFYIQAYIHRLFIEI